MRQLSLLAAAAAIVSLSPFLMSGAGAMKAGTASGVRQGAADTSMVEQVVRVCRHNMWTSRRVCWTDRTRPPTVCHHIRSTSRRDCY